MTHTRHHHLHAATVLALVVGIVMTIESSAMQMKAQVINTDQGAVLSTAEFPVQTLHGAAPILTNSHWELLAGMAMILAGFILALILSAQERRVRVTVRKSMRRRSVREQMRDVEWFWVRMDV